MLPTLPYNKLTQEIVSHMLYWIELTLGDKELAIGLL